MKAIRWACLSAVSGETSSSGNGQMIVCEGMKNGEDFPCRIKVPKDFGKATTKEIPDKGDGIISEAEGIRERRKATRKDLSFAPAAYHSLLKNPRFSGLLHLLGDEDLGELMRIPYPAEAVEIAAVVGESSDVDIIREAIARQLKKKPDELTDDDYGKITELELRGSEISDLEPIKKLTSLRELDLSRTQVANDRVTELKKALPKLEIFR